MEVVAAGRINLIGDHTDYTGGYVLPMAIDLSTTVRGERGGHEVRLRSDSVDGEALVPIDIVDPASVEPPWARYVAGVVAELRPAVGFRGTVQSTLPLGAGLASSAALELAVAGAIGDERDPLTLALACQRAEHRGPQVPCGIMDQLAIATAREGNALLIDCRGFEWRQVPIADDVVIHAVHCGEPRQLAESAYAERRAQSAAAESTIGPLRDAQIDDVARIADPLVRRRARHVITENERVLEFALALGEGDYAHAGALMYASHCSLRDDFEVSTPALDALVEKLRNTAGVFGARLTGAGFGGSVVALARPSAQLGGWRLRPRDGLVVRP